MQLAAPGSLVQRLNIFHLMLEPITTEIDFVFRDRIEHERVIRVRRMTQRKDFCALLLHLFRIRTCTLKAMRECIALPKRFAQNMCPTFALFRVNFGVRTRPRAPLACQENGIGIYEMSKRSLTKNKTAAARFRAAAAC